MPKTIAENIDMLCAVEMRAAIGNMPRGYIRPLYEAAREVTGEPLTYALASALQEGVTPGDQVFILTGAGGPPILPLGEVDGIPGAAALAKALHFGLGCEVTILGEGRIRRSVEVALSGCGMNFRTLADPHYPHAVTFVASPEDPEEWARVSHALLDEHQPVAVIAIEKLSPNSAGVTHSVAGIDCTFMHADPAILIDEAKRRSIFTAGIGDGGNEVGFGLIEETVRKTLPRADVCQCPCGQGMASSLVTDVLVVSAISDWGAYGVAALLAFLKADVGLLITSDELEAMLRNVVLAGSYDGMTSRPTLSDDGVPLHVQRAFLDMLRGIVENGNARVNSPGHDPRTFRGELVPHRPV